MAGRQYNQIDLRFVKPVDHMSGVTNHLQEGDNIMALNEQQVKYWIQQERKLGTPLSQLIFIMNDNGVPLNVISNFMDISIKYVETVLSDN